MAKMANAPVVDADTMNAITIGTAGQHGAGGAVGKDGISVPAQKLIDAASL
jgi:hypothetical protein